MRKAVPAVMAVAAMALAGCGTTKAVAPRVSDEAPASPTSAAAAQVSRSPLPPSPASPSAWGPWITARADLDSSPSSGAPDCPAYDHIDSLVPLAKARIPRDFHAVAIVVCSAEPRTVAGRDWWYVTQRQATVGVDRFVHVLRSPDDRRSTGLCSTAGITVPYLLLRSDDGSLLWPRLPQDSCNFVLGQVYGSLDRLHLTVISERRDTPVYEGDQERADEAGCGADDGDAFSAPQDYDEPPSTSRGIEITTTDAFSACRYRLSPTDATQGLFESGRRQNLAQSRALIALVNASTPASPCHAKPTRVTTLFDDAGDVQVMVELDGCRRVLDFSSNTLAQATPELLVALS